MGGLLDYLKSQNVSGKEILIPTPSSLPKTNQVSFSEYNRTLENNLKPVDFEADSNYSSLDNERNDIRAKQQSGWSKAVNTLGQGIGTFLTATASSMAAIPSIAAGLGAEITTGGEAEGMDIALNNPVMRGINDFDKYLKEEIVPTYYTQEQQNSLLSASTGTDLVNGVGFLLSNILPTVAVTKALGGLPKLAALAKVGKLESNLEIAIGKGLIKAEEAGKLNALGKFFEKAPAITGALVGRLGESAMEANGVYDSILAEGGTEEEAKRQRDNVFFGNMALAGSDVAQYTRWFKPFGLADDIIKKEIGYTAKQKTKGELVGDFVKESLQEAGEEGYQFLMQKGGENAAKNGQSFISNALDASGDLFTTVEGQKSMLLGAVLGGGASAAFNKKNAPQKALQLQQMINELNQNPGIVEDKYIETIDGKRILNPNFVRQTETFLNLEQLRNQALESGDTETAELIEKQQFANLVQSRVENNKFDDLIDELESLSRTKDSELAQYFGNVPIDSEGNKLSASQIATNKIQEAKQIKKNIEGLNLIPEYNQLSLRAKNDFVNHVLIQDNLLSQIRKVDTKIAAIEGTKTFIIPITQGITNEEIEQINPLAEKQIKELKTTRDELVNNYNKINDSIKDVLKNPSKLETKIEEKEKQNLEKLTNEIEKQDNILTEIDVKLAELKNLESIFTIPGTDIQVQNVDGNLIDAETGEPIDESFLIEAIKQDILDKQDKIEEGFTKEDDYDDNLVPLSGSAKKLNINSTSTRGHYFNPQGSKETTSYGDPANPNPQDEIAYRIDTTFASIVNWMSKWLNTPFISNKVYTARLTKQDPSTINLEEINNWRETKAKESGLKFDPLTLEDLLTPAYAPIQISVLENGIAVSEDLMHFHDVDYFYYTQEYDNLVKALGAKEITQESFDVEVTKGLEKIVNQRKQLLVAMETEDVQLPISGKSNGIINYNPRKNGKQQVLPIFHLGQLGGKILKKDKNNKPLIYSRGLGTIIGETEDFYIVEYEGNKEDNTQGQKGSIDKKEFAGYIGQTVFETVSANGTPIVTATTQSDFTDEQLDSMVTLLLHRLTTGSNEIKVGNQSFDIIGKIGNRGIIDSLILWGFRTTKKETQIQFSKDGSLVLGKKTIAPNDPNAKSLIKNFLAINKQTPSFKVGSLNSKIVLPTEIVDGEAKGDIQTVSKLLFGGTSPLIGTNINSKIPFINSYFTFETKANGDLEIITSKKEEITPEYLNDLNITFGEALTIEETNSAENIGELTDDGTIKPVETKLATEKLDKVVEEVNKECSPKGAIIKKSTIKFKKK